MVDKLVLFQWSEKYATGHAEIDSQHMRLVSMINELHEALSEGKGKKTSSGILERLVEYAGYHFKTEEKLMQKWVHENMGIHINEHRAFLSRVLEMSRDLDNGEYMVSIELNEFLKEWLSQHILGTDMLLVEHIR